MSHGIPMSERLGEKLQQIRVALNLSQNEMIDHLGLREIYSRSYISLWENGKSEPSLNVLLRFAYAAGVSVDALADDAINLPSSKLIHQYHTHARKMTHKFPTSERLSEKLYQVRAGLNMSQNEMIDHLGLKGVFDRAYVSFWENGKTEPPLNGVVRYARAGGLSLNHLADDAINIALPEHICHSPRV